MAQQKIKLMISSRCNTTFPLGAKDGKTLTEIRKRIKKEIEAESFLGKKLVAVWINEEEFEAGDQTAWDACVKQAQDCDIFISLWDGDAGWQADGSGIGICHAEFETAYSLSPGKVAVISLFSGTPKLKQCPNSEYWAYLQKANVWQSQGASNEEELIGQIKKAVNELVLKLCHQGARELKQSAANTGQALDWSRMNFSDRQKAMICALSASMIAKDNSKENEEGIFVSIKSKKILFRVSAIPAALTVSAAREMVGQPFLQDYKLNHVLGPSKGGPVHIIACQKSVTEAQSISFLGFPDATIISGSFGVYVADNIQKIQLCFISNCRDAASTKHGLQKFFEWVERTGEDQLLAERSISRAKIIKTIAGEI
jgi:hypothetical protein